MLFIYLTLEVKVLSSGFISICTRNSNLLDFGIIIYVSYGFGGNHIYIDVFFMMCVTKSRHVFCQTSPCFLLFQ
jgi:hypothetical protein